MQLDELDTDTLDDFLNLGLIDKIRLINLNTGKRLWSRQVVEILSRMLTRDMDAGKRAALLRDIIALAPDSLKAEQVFQRLLYPAEPISAGIHNRVYLMMSCAKYSNKSDRLLSELGDRLSPIFIVIGNPELTSAKFDGHMLYVPSSDNYESHPVKIFEAFFAVRQRFGAVDIVKMDDDLVVLSDYDIEQANTTLSSLNYAGEPAGGEMFDRCWHFGKVEDQTIGPYTKRFHGQWCRGPLYSVSARAVESLLREFLFYPGTLLGEFYEDKLVGDILRQCKIPISPCDIGRMLGVSAGNEVPPELPGALNT